jgi:hypothetical protein
MPSSAGSNIYTLVGCHVESGLGHFYVDQKKQQHLSTKHIISRHKNMVKVRTNSTWDMTRKHSGLHSGLYSGLDSNRPVVVIFIMRQFLN